MRTDRTAERAFTLVELVVVVVVLGVLAALAVPALRAVVDRARTDTAARAWEAVVGEAAALAALDGRDAVSADDVAVALGDLAAADTVLDRSTTWTYEANGDDDGVLAAGEWVVDDLAAPDALVARPDDLTGDRVVVVDLAASPASATVVPYDVPSGDGPGPDRGDTAWHLGSDPAAAAPSSQTLAAIVEADGPAVWWPLGDPQPAAGTGTLAIASSVGFVPDGGPDGRSGAVLALPGAAGGHATGPHLDLAAGEDATLEGWVSLAAGSTPQRLLSTRVAGGDGLELGVTSSGAPVALLASGGDVAIAIGPEPAGPDEWVHLALVRADGRLQLWAAGLLVAEVASPTGPVDGGPLWIGERDGDPGLALTGRVAHVAAHRRALPAASLGARASAAR